MNRFRPVNGLPDEDLKLVWSQLAEGSVWVSRPAKYQGLEDIVALKEYCKALKDKDKLGKAIVKYWMTRYQEDFNTWGQLAVSYTIPEPWLGEMLKYLPEKPEKPEKEVVTEDVSSSDGDDEDSSKKKKKPLVLMTKKGLEEMVPKKGEGAEALNIKNKVPRWEFVNLSSPDVEGYSPEKLFCLGGMSSTSPTVRRNLFSSRSMERHLSVNGDRIRSWYQRYKSLKVPTSSGPQPTFASSSQQPGLASTSQQPARAVTDEDEIEDTDVAKFVFDHEVENEARTHLGNARRRVVLNPNIV
ncbi:hypothetical protein R1sor_026437 [Riccia sorocarpa]|uniref:Transposase n=1 Tax=Riccia sorocarpa TaxID=122646 RepID=A0ABD3GH22_9MARC